MSVVNVSGGAVCQAGGEPRQAAPCRGSVVKTPAASLERLYRLLRCTRCGGALSEGGGALRCTGCDAVYPLQYGAVPSFVGRREELSPSEGIELDNLELQLEEFYSPDWRVGYNPSRVALIEAELPDGMILDVGAADGQIAAHLTTSRRLVVGSEKSSRWLDKHGEVNVPFVIADVYRLPFAAQTFDGAVMGELLEHLYDPAAALSAVADKLVAGGILVGTVPNFYFVTKRLRYLSGRFGEGEAPLSHAHIRLFSKQVLAELLAACGFVDVRITGILHRELPEFPGRRLLERLQMTAAGLWPELLAVTFFFRARKR